MLGPVILNLLYEDARRAANKLRFSESVFADDFICWRGFSIKIPTQQREAHIAEQQETLSASYTNCKRKCMFGAKQTL